VSKFDVWFSQKKLATKHLTDLEIQNKILDKMNTKIETIEKPNPLGITRGRDPGEDLAEGALALLAEDPVLVHWARPLP